MESIREANSFIVDTARPNKGSCARERKAPRCLTWPVFVFALFISCAGAWGKVGGGKEAGKAGHP